MANFPTSPTTGDTFHSGSNLYSWTGTAWKIVAGDRPDYGVVTFEGQSFGTPPDVLYHFNSDSSSTPIDATGNTTATYYGDAGLATSANDSPAHFPENSSAYFDGTGDGITVAYPSSLALDAEFTIDFWFRLNDVTAYQSLLYPVNAGSSTNHYVDISWMTGGYFQIMANDGGNSATVVPGTQFFSTTVVNNTWYHLAVTRDSSFNWKGYLNGEEGGGSSGAALGFRNKTINFNGGCKIGDGGFGAFGGNIDEFRIIKGSRAWTADFSSTFSSSPPGPYDENVIPPLSAIAGKSQIYAKDVVVAPSSSGSELVLHFDGNLNDTSGNNHTVTGNGTIAYSSSGAGGSGASGYDQGLDFDETSTHLKFSDIDIGTSDFTVEWWWKWPTPITSGQSYNIICYTDPGTGQTGAFGINHSTNWGHDMWINQYNGSGSQSSHLYVGFTPTVGNWYHWAVVRDQTQIRLYVGSAGSSTGNYRTAASAVPYYVGGIGTDWFLGTPTGNYVPGGTIDDFRITKSALYTGTGTYTLPVAPFADGNPGSTTTELYMMDGSGTETKLT